MRIAVLADIHGNLPALEAVLADMEQRRTELVVNLGDCASGPLWPAETLDVLMRKNWPTVRGNHDRQVASLGGGTELGESDRYAMEQLTDKAKRWLGSRPTSLALGRGILALHARPDNDSAYLIETQLGRLLHQAAPEIVAARLGSADATLVLTAHSHRAASLRLHDGRWVVNPGSVGCPAYHDDSTMPPHVSEAGCPSARYAILDMTDATVMIEHLSIPYPHEIAARRAEDLGRVDWAHALRTGFMPRTAA